MSDNKLKVLKSLLIPSDIMPISMIIIGIIISIFIPEIAIKLIGVSISLLGVVVLLMKLTTRMSSSIESKFKTNPPPNFKITVKKSPEAVRQVIENFDEEDAVDSDFESNTKISNNNMDTKPREVSKETMGEEEGFRIIKKDKVETNDNIADNGQEPTIEEDTKDVLEQEIEPGLAQKEKFKQTQDISTNRFRKREIEIPTQGLLEEMPLLKEHPDKEFEFLINRILMAIRSVSNTKTSAFFFFNEQKDQIILNAFASDSKRLVELRTKFTSSNDIISQIARSMKPEILSDINPAAELDLLPYYRSNSGTNSFIGIPVIYDKSVIGVLTADSKHSDAYDAVMVNFLSHFAKMISGLIRSYSDKYELVQDSKYLDILKKFDSLITLQNNKKIFDELTDTIFGTFGCENVYLLEVEKNTNKYKFVSIANVGNSNFTEGFQFYNSDSVLAEAIGDRTDIYLSRVESETIKICEGEKSTSSYFYVTPISTNIDIYGALAIEGKEGSFLDKSERTFIKLLSDKCAKLVENLQLITILENGFDRDPESGLLTGTAIENELTKEIKRVSSFNYNSSVVSICFDRYESIDSGSDYIKDTITKHINQYIDSSLDELDIKGKQDDNLIVILSGKNAQTSKLWAERIRNKIASETLLLSEKHYNITVSIGICELKPDSKCKEIMKNSLEALNVSKEKSNTVSVYS